MTIETRIFGEVTIDDNKIIHFENGIVGFPDLTDFALIYDAEDGNDVGIRWMQSLQETNFAMPVMDPLLVKEDYNPIVDDEMLKSLGSLDVDQLLVLVTITVPKDIKEMSANLMGPLVINAETKKAVQIIVDGDYPVKFPIYDILDARKKVGTC
ncbi:MAG: flagellar assembly protein FliW [Lachnospiraceae bacterium]|nr:flagellar assembly protein FliW [Lachnospiraceae bacterium]